MLNATAGGFITSRGYRLSKKRSLSARSRVDRELIPVIQHIHASNYSCYGVRKMWKALHTAQYMIGREHTRRLMKLACVQGSTRGRKPTTTISSQVECASDLVKRDFKASKSNQLWVADFTYVRTLNGFAYTAFVTDVYSRKIVGWNTSSTMSTQLPLHAVEQAITQAKSDITGVIHHSDKGSQYTSITYTQKLTEHGALLSTGTTGDSYDNALAESVNAAYKTELTKTRTWKNGTDLEIATLQWVHWWNNTRLHASLNYITPQAFEDNQQNTSKNHETSTPTLVKT